MPLVPSNDPAARDGKIHSHRFPGANTALPFVNGDKEQLEVTQAFLKSGAVTIDVFGLVRGGEGEAASAKAAGGAEPRLSSTFAQGEESMSFGASQAAVHERFRGDRRRSTRWTPRCGGASRRGSRSSCAPARSATSSRAARSTRSTSGSSSRSTDSNGRKIFHSGYAEDGGKGPVEPGAHFYRSLQLDEHGNPINKRNAWSTRSVAYVRLIPPGAADTIHYRLRVPEDCGRPPDREGEAQLPQVRVVEHAVVVRRRARPRAPRLLADPGPRRRPVGLHRRHVEGLRRHQGDPRHRRRR